MLITYQVMGSLGYKQQSAAALLEARDSVFKTLRNNLKSPAAIRRSTEFSENKALSDCLTTVCSVDTGSSPAEFSLYTSSGSRLTAAGSAPAGVFYSPNGLRCAGNSCQLRARSYFVAICDDGITKSPCLGTAKRIEFHVAVESASTTGPAILGGKVKTRHSFGNAAAGPKEAPSPVSIDRETVVGL